MANYFSTLWKHPTWTAILPTNAFVRPHRNVLQKKALFSTQNLACAARLCVKHLRIV